MDKKEIIQQILEAQNEVVNNLEKSVNSYKSEADIDENDGSIDPEDLSNQTTAKDMQLRMDLALSGAKVELERIKQYVDVQSDKAIAGSIVETKDKFFFLGSGITNLDVKNKELLGVSIDAPAYNEIFGKQKGDTIQLGTNSFEILGVY